LLHVSVTSNHDHAHILVDGHDMFSASENTLVNILKYQAAYLSKCLKFYTANANNMHPPL